MAQSPVPAGDPLTAQERGAAGAAVSGDGTRLAGGGTDNGDSPRGKARVAPPPAATGGPTTGARAGRSAGTAVRVRSARPSTGRSASEGDTGGSRPAPADPGSRAPPVRAVARTNGAMAGPTLRTSAGRVGRRGTVERIDGPGGQRHEVGDGRGPERPLDRVDRDGAGANGHDLGDGREPGTLAAPDGDDPAVLAARTGIELARVERELYAAKLAGPDEQSRLSALRSERRVLVERMAALADAVPADALPSAVRLTPGIVADAAEAAARDEAALVEAAAHEEAALAEAGWAEPESGRGRRPTGRSRRPTGPMLVSSGSPRLAGVAGRGPAGAVGGRPRHRSRRR